MLGHYGTVRERHTHNMEAGKGRVFGVKLMIYVQGPKDEEIGRWLYS